MGPAQTAQGTQQGPEERGNLKGSGRGFRHFREKSGVSQLFARVLV